MNQITDSVVKIDTLPDHPHLCFYNSNTIYNFYNDNRAAINSGGLRQVEIKHGAIDKGLLPNAMGISSCKVQVPILIFKIDGNYLLGREANFENPFKNHALDIGQVCPPGTCSCN
jgi:hypothetical protein